MKRSPAVSWRQQRARYNLEGSNCSNCKTPHFPSRPVCPDCGHSSNKEGLRAISGGKERRG